MQITKNLSVSIDLPGPTNSSHHPGLPLVAAATPFPREATCDEADSPVCSRIALDAVASSVPHVSYAIE